MSTADPLVALYQSRSADFAGRQAHCAARSRRIGWARIGVFLAMIGALAGGLEGATSRPRALLWLGAALGGTFGALVVRHTKVDEQDRWFGALRQVNDEGVARVERRWDRLKVPAMAATPDHPYASDLDLFGRASLFQLLDVSTGIGETTLARWLLAPAPLTELRLRQHGIRALAPLIAFRQALGARGRMLGEGTGDEMTRFVEWSAEPSWLLQRSWLLWVARVTTAAIVVFITMHAAGLVDRAWWLIPMTVSIALIALVGPRAHHAFDRASGAGHVIRRYSPLFETAAAAPSGGTMLDRLAADLRAGGSPAHIALRRLNSDLALSDLRLSAALLAFPVNVITLWDLHVWDRLERWRFRCGPYVPRWMSGLGELCALAGLLHDNADWAFADFLDGNDDLPPQDRVLRGEALAHPLLPAKVRVANDVEVGPPGTFLLATIEDGVDGPVMRFDYRLHPGIATSTNALRLMRMIGLDDEMPY